MRRLKHRLKVIPVRGMLFKVRGLVVALVEAQVDSWYAMVVKEGDNPEAYPIGSEILVFNEDLEDAEVVYV